MRRGELAPDGVGVPFSSSCTRAIEGRRESASSLMRPLTPFIFGLKGSGMGSGGAIARRISFWAAEVGSFALPS